jgi:hypothetical protein
MSVTGRATDMDDGQALDRPAVDDAARWISFADLAALRGISRASASKLVRRHGWRRQTDNQGRVLILVPAEALDRPTDTPPDRPSPMTDGRAADSPSDRPMDAAAFEIALAAIEAAHAVEVATLRERVNASDALADRSVALLADAEERAGRTLALLADASARTDRLERDLAAAVTAADAARADARTAQEAADALRQADAVRKARGRLRRAWEGWRGR